MSTTTMAAVCQICGASGFSEVITSCIECGISAVHRYCLDAVLEIYTGEVNWSCEQCSPQPAKVFSSQRLNLRLKEKWEMKRKKWETMRKKWETKTKRRKWEKERDPANISLKLMKKKDNILPLVDVEVSRLDRSPPDEKKKSLHVCNEKSDGGELLKKVRRLVLSYCSDEDSQSIKTVQDDSEDGGRTKSMRRLVHEDSQSMKNAQVDTNQDFANGNASQAENPSILSSSTTAVIKECNACSGPVSDACDAPLSIISHQPSVEFNSYVRAQPVRNPIWSGCFGIHNKSYGRIAGHLSTKAHSKVCEVANMFAPILSVEKLRRSVAWPKSFCESPPTEDNIGLYFFPESGRDEFMFFQLVDEVIKEDLVLKVEIDTAELLVFSSFQLPPQDWKFYGQVYLWGAFRARPQTPATNSTIDRALSISMDEVDDLRGADVKSRESMSPVSTLSRSLLGLSRSNDDARDLENVRKEDESNKQSSDFCLCVKEEQEEVGLCLELFPSQVENMGISAKMGQNIELDLELGLGRSMGKSGDGLLAFKTKSSQCTIALENVIF